VTFERTADPVGKALWYIETHFASELTLDDIANASDLSRYHLSRAFPEVTGTAVMRYVRARRLTQAARRLADGAADILAVALDAGYASHEAFTRAFRDLFGQTPEAIRRQGSLEGLELIEPLRKDPTMNATLEKPRVENAPLLLVSGLSRRYSRETLSGIPSQWQQFVPYIGYMPAQVSDSAYGVCTNADENANMTYLCGVEVSAFGNIPEEFVTLRIPQHRYAVFTHEGHISTIQATWEAIFRTGLPELGAQLADAPDFEKYDERFDPRSGNGIVEIWVPLA
jgi:AraC family transcriptional regulator